VIREKECGHMRVSLKDYTLLDGSKMCLVQRVGDGSIIKRFDKTPPPVKSTSVVCPHFLELKWAYGCPFNCAWCYLKGTFRFLPTGTRPILKNYSKIESHLHSIGLLTYFTNKYLRLKTTQYLITSLEVVVGAGADTFPTAEISDRCVSTKALENNADFPFSGKLAAGNSFDIAD
jgi:hypothetical protein